MMNNIILIIGLLGSLASIYGAYLSIRAKNKAQNSAEIAESAKNQILQKQTTTQLSGVLYETKTLQQAFGKYSITQDEGLTGVNFQKDSQVLQSYIFLFNENRAKIESSTEMDTENIYNSLNDLLENFTKQEFSTEKKKYGTQIRLMADDIIFKLRKTVDERNINTK